MKKTTHLLFTFILLGCHDDDDTSISEIDTVEPPNIAADLSLTADDIVENDQNQSVFITNLSIPAHRDLISSISFEIEPKPNTFSEPIKASFTGNSITTSAENTEFPVFGLYNNYDNEVQLNIVFSDDSIAKISKTIRAEGYIDENSIYDDIKVNQRVASQKPSYNYIHLESSTNQGPVIIDIDGNVRWVANTPTGNYRAAVFEHNKFIIQDNNGLVFLSLDGTITETNIVSNSLSNITPHHETTFGKSGYLLNIDADKNGSRVIEAIVIEVDRDGNIISEWDFEEIVRNHMLSEGDDPSTFVITEIDWFHMNSAIYDERDNSIIASSRENFIIKVDYDTKEIKWLFGDETKHWYVSFPSLQPLSISANGTKPIGQHSLSIVGGNLMFFNNGQRSFNQPDGAPVGDTLPTSLTMAYSIDEPQLLANLEWSYDAGLQSDICSSVYKEGSSYLITYAAVDRLNDNPTRTVIQGIDEGNNLIFEFEHAGVDTQGRPCRTWNSDIVDLSNVSFN
ncbi:aryl-sulfate sulfotransferase [Photobacterium satsumensis]|uniref:aryl-sulfate sulfotransferase n=1 Tax=Photobacterium satsumensis TaxID=2910239 RepID=UPI003D0EC9E0